MKRAKIKRKDYDDIYDCIVTDQMSAADIAYYFSYLKFLSWFKKKRK